MPKSRAALGTQTQLFDTGAPLADLSDVKRGLSEAIKTSPYSRAQIADFHAAFTGRATSLSQVNDWLTPTKPHEPPLSFLRVVTAVTRHPGGLDPIAAQGGSRVVDEADYELLTLAKLREQRERLDAEIEALAARRKDRWGRS